MSTRQSIFMRGLLILLACAAFLFIDSPEPMFENALQTGTSAFAQTSGTTSASSASYIEGRISARKAYHEIGKNYVLVQDFGTTPDMSGANLSKLRIYENGKELGPAHSAHADIRTLGRGRFSHWGGSDGSAPSALYFSASDNSNPRTNGRKYTYRIYVNSAPPAGSTSGTSTTNPPPVSPPTSSPTQPAPAPTPTPTAPSPTPTGSAFYVSPTGSDSNPGTLNSPWRTIQGAAQKLKAGETAILLDGVYEEPSITFANSGTSGSPITIRAQNKWGAILSSTSGGNPAFSVATSYITIENVRISVSPNNVYNGAYTSANAAIRAWDGAQGFVARGLLVDATSARDTGIKTNQDFSIIENCVVYNEIEAFNTNAAIIRNNTVYSGSPTGTHILGKGGVRNMQIYGNVVHITKAGGSGILIGGSSSCCWYDSSTGAEAYNAVAYNNVVINETGLSDIGLFGMWGAHDSAFINNVGIGGQLFLALGGSDGNEAPRPTNVNPTFKNNILLGKGGAATSGYNGWNGYWSGTLTVDHNNFHNFSSGVPAQTNPIVGDPLLVNPSSDWHVRPGSPALGSGISVFLSGFNGEGLDVSQNKDGVARVEPWNLGIY